MNRIEFNDTTDVQEEKLKSAKYNISLSANSKRYSIMTNDKALGVRTLLHMLCGDKRKSKLTGTIFKLEYDYRRANLRLDGFREVYILDIYGQEMVSMEEFLTYINNTGNGNLQ